MTEAERAAIIKAAVEGTKAEFAGEVAKRTSLTQAEVLKLAKTPEEREAMARVLAEVTKGATSNASKAAAIRNITGGVEALVRIAGLVI